MNNGTSIGLLRVRVKLLLSGILSSEERMMIQLFTPYEFSIYLSENILHEKNLLDLAIEEEQFSLCHELLNHGYTVRDSHVLQAIREGKLSHLHFFLSHMESVRVKNLVTGAALFEAARVGHPYILRTLLSYGADLHSVDSDGNTPLVLAASLGHADVIRFLLDHGAKLHTTDTRAKEPLLTAVCGGHTDAVKILLDRGSDVNMQDKNGETPLTVAVKRGYTDIVKLLLERGADVHSTDKDGNTPLHSALLPANGGPYYHIAHLLRKHEAGIMIRNKRHVSPLSLYAKDWSCFTFLCMSIPWSIGWFTAIVSLHVSKDYLLGDAAAYSYPLSQFCVPIGLLGGLIEGVAIGLFGAAPIHETLGRLLSYILIRTSFIGTTLLSLILCGMPMFVFNIYGIVRLLINEHYSYADLIAKLFLFTDITLVIGVTCVPLFYLFHFVKDMICRRF